MLGSNMFSYSGKFPVLRTNQLKDLEQQPTCLRISRHANSADAVAQWAYRLGIAIGHGTDVIFCTDLRTCLET